MISLIVACLIGLGPGPAEATRAASEGVPFYRPRPVTVRAIRWFAAVDVPPGWFPDADYPGVWTEDVYETNVETPYGPRTFQLPSVFHVTDVRGRDVRLTPGDWLVFGMKASRPEVLSDDAFRAKYEPAGAIP